MPHIFIQSGSAIPDFLSLFLEIDRVQAGMKGAVSALGLDVVVDIGTLDRMAEEHEAVRERRSLLEPTGQRRYAGHSVVAYIEPTQESFAVQLNRAANTLGYGPM